MKLLLKYSLYGTVLWLCANHTCFGQALNADSVKMELQGAWRMNADSNMVLVFTGDSMTHHMMRSWGMGKARFTLSNRNCDTTRFIKKDALYLLETYRYYHAKQAMNGEMCNKIVYFKSGVMILKRDGLFETYTKIK
ncbi:MAG TPA: hypothetical protein VN922_07615 [Bacteroidia bacterium]|nr:hypothetical protein [Bacteroidia bacterium]